MAVSIENMGRGGEDGVVKKNLLGLGMALSKIIR
jgi:hypothetical protein